jgi:hypothetical protein
VKAVFKKKKINDNVLGVQPYRLIDWLVFNVQRAIFQLYSGREHLNVTGLETRKGDG